MPKKKLNTVKSKPMKKQPNKEQDKLQKTAKAVIAATKEVSDKKDAPVVITPSAEVKTNHKNLMEELRAHFNKAKADVAAHVTENQRAIAGSAASGLVLAGGGIATSTSVAAAAPFAAMAVVTAGATYGAVQAVRAFKRTLDASGIKQADSNQPEPSEPPKKKKKKA